MLKIEYLAWSIPGGEEIIKDIDVIAFYTAAFVFSGVDNAVDHHFCTVRDDIGIHRNGVVGSGNGAGAGAAAPAFRTALAGTVSGGFEYPQRTKAGLPFVILLGSADYLICRCNENGVGTVRQSGPVYRNQKTAGAASVAAGRYIIPLDAGFGGLLEHQISGAVRNRDLYRQRNVRV